ncbi:hypothetical protein RJ640_010427 [Escallonia rubra]|uniref:Protein DETOXIFICATION n=1 Tax=Escallonia rubra TaxID=112253 RepID=A0AA88UKP7_9ASTE|nr:hypothetical protein RJ640_010427 [Escallonia rubra]
MANNGTATEEPTVPLLNHSSSTLESKCDDFDDEQNLKLRLWHIVGPTIFSRIASYSTFLITQAFAGHLGDLDLAAISISTNVIVGFDFGLLLEMASALETLCGQAFGANNHKMMGVYLQRSWIVLFMCCILVFATFPICYSSTEAIGRAIGHSRAVWGGDIVFHSSSFQPCFSVSFAESQLKTAVIDSVSLGALVVHVLVSWLIVYELKLGVIGTALSLNFSWWLIVFGLFLYCVRGGCPLSWTGFSIEAFSGLWEFVKLSTASGVMLCLENWYYRVLIVLTGNLKNAEIALVNQWISADDTSYVLCCNWSTCCKRARSRQWKRSQVCYNSVGEDIYSYGCLLLLLIMIFHNDIAQIFSSSKSILDVVDDLSILLAFTILFNSVQPVLSGVATGCGWQSYVAYINLGSYYLIGVPLGVVRRWLFDLGVKIDIWYENGITIVNLGWNDFWWICSSDFDIGHHYPPMFG